MSVVKREQEFRSVAPSAVSRKAPASECHAPLRSCRREFHCSFEEDPICMFTQDKNDDFDWTRHSAATRDTKYTPNTGPSGDRSGSKQDEVVCFQTSDEALGGRSDELRLMTGRSGGNERANAPRSRSCFYMYIETSRPRKEGDTARLLSPTFNVAPKNPYSITSPPAYCFSFYYHMYGKHIDPLHLKDSCDSCANICTVSMTSDSLDGHGTLNAFVKQKVQSTSDAGPVWSLSGNQGDRWRQAKISIHPTASFQVIFEGIRGPGIEGDIAIDDVTLEEGECPDPPSNRMYQAWISTESTVITREQTARNTEMRPGNGLELTRATVRAKRRKSFLLEPNDQRSGGTERLQYMAIERHAVFYRIHWSEVTLHVRKDSRRVSQYLITKDSCFRIAEKAQHRIHTE
ncbi:hypothetical protein H4Q32_015257 [Labeo rohita]|uniref:MAM domain-containing protein n=1 Tax=Labeo rohita TaxID=84645 RepID=A0ABQ8LNY2_LABRO|nr:hypothetical protein H4Q32_015257 [Labeo rohita]